MTWDHSLRTEDFSYLQSKGNNACPSAARVMAVTASRTVKMTVSIRDALAGTPGAKQRDESRKDLWALKEVGELRPGSGHGDL